MSEEITATKDELAKDLISVIRQNKLLIDQVNALQCEIKSLQNKLLKSSESEFFAKGRANQLKAFYNEARTKLRHANNKIANMEDKK
jgi:hypothetical protein